MRSRKNAVPVPVTRDLLQEKQTEVARLARQASEAVDIVTRTMNELEGIRPTLCAIVANRWASNMFL